LIKFLALVKIRIPKKAFSIVSWQLIAWKVLCFMLVLLARFISDTEVKWKAMLRSELHFATTQNLIKILKEEDKEGFTSVVKKNEDKIYEVYENAAKSEMEWAQYLFSKGSLLGLNADVLGGYSKWLCDTRLRSLGYKKIFNQKENPISGWLDSYLDSSKVQVAPQETEIGAYKIGARDTSISDKDFNDIEL